MVKKVTASSFIKSVFKELINEFGLEEYEILSKVNVSSQLWVTVPSEVAIILKLIAAMKGRSIQDILREAIEDYIKKWYNEYGGGSNE